MATYGPATFADQTPRDADGFAPAQHGGVVNVKYAAFAYTDTTAKALFTLPKGAEIVGWNVNITTAFNSSGTDLLDVGDGTTANRFANDLVLSTAAQLVTGFDPDEMFVELTDDTTIYATYVQSVADADAGQATLACFYIIR
jgi:hypothetical protein